jgi:hypothetical protein
MSKILIECAECGEICGSYWTAQLSGPPEDCYAAEYGTEPEVIDDDGREFCSQACADEYHGVDEENVEEEK